MFAYVAGSLPFTEAGRLYQRGLLAPALRQAGYRLTATWGSRAIRTAENIRFADEDDRRYIWRGKEKVEWFAGKKGMSRADLVVAVLDGAPFDSRLVAEVAYVPRDNQDESRPSIRMRIAVSAAA